jgi:hypothetical protein
MLTLPAPSLRKQLSATVREEAPMERDWNISAIETVKQSPKKKPMNLNLRQTHTCSCESAGLAQYAPVESVAGGKPRV